MKGQSSRVEEYLRNAVRPASSEGREVMEFTDKRINSGEEEHSMSKTNGERHKRNR